MRKIKLVAITLLLGFSISLLAQEATKKTVSEVADAPPVQKKSTIERVTSWYMDNMNYGTITLFMTMESTVIPFPSEIIVPPAAYKASQENSDLNIFLVIVFATIGAIIGSLINYSFALWLGRPIIHRFADSKLGRMCLLDSEKVKKAENYFVKHGKSSTFIGRFVVGVRHLISIPAGLAKMPLLPFLAFTALGAGLWNVILAVTGYLAHGQASLIDKYSKEISYILLVLGVGFVMYLVYNGFIKKKKRKTDTENS